MVVGWSTRENPLGVNLFEPVSRIIRRNVRSRIASWREVFVDWTTRENPLGGNVLDLVNRYVYVSICYMYI